jgi:hypothetical protein
MKLTLYNLVPTYPSSTIYPGPKFPRLPAGGAEINQYTNGRAQEVIYFTNGTIFGVGNSVTLTEN